MTAELPAGLTSQKLKSLDRYHLIHPLVIVQLIKPLIKFPHTNFFLDQTYQILPKIRKTKFQVLHFSHKSKGRA